MKVVEEECVVWDGTTSRHYSTKQGVKQGGVLSTNMYKEYINPLLQTIESEGLGAKIGNTHIASSTYADDILLLDLSAPPTWTTSTTPDLDTQAMSNSLQ